MNTMSRPFARAVLGVTACLFVASELRADDGLLRYLPSDTKVVLTIHVNRLGAGDRERGQAMVRQLYQTHICPSLQKDDPLPLRDLDQIVLALPYAGTFNGVVLIHGKIDRKLFEQQMNKAARASDVVSVQNEGKPPLPVYRCKLDEKVLIRLLPALGKIPQAVRRLVAPQEVRVAALDDATLVASLAGPAPVTRALRARPAKSTLRLSAEMAKLLRKPHKSAVATVVLTDDSLHPGLQLISDESTKETFDQFDHVQLNVTGGRKIEVETVVQGKSADLGPVLEKKTRRVLEVIQEQLPTVMPNATRRAVIDHLVKSFRVQRKEGRVTVTGSMSDEDAKDFLKGDKKDR